jgi:hypothetical protein
MTALLQEFYFLLYVLQFLLRVLARVGHFLYCYNVIIVDLSGKVNIAEASMTNLLKGELYNHWTDEKFI